MLCDICYARVLAFVHITILAIIIRLQYVFTIRKQQTPETRLIIINQLGHLFMCSVNAYSPDLWLSARVLGTMGAKISLSQASFTMYQLELLRLYAEWRGSNLDPSL